MPCLLAVMLRGVRCDAADSPGSRDLAQMPGKA
jgi:hypothetical protein